MIVTEMVTDRKIMHHHPMVRVELFREDQTFHGGRVHCQLSRSLQEGRSWRFPTRELGYMPRASDKIPESVTTSRRLLEAQVDQRPAMLEDVARSYAANRLMTSSIRAATVCGSL
jgi:hypothetical protein